MASYSKICEYCQTRFETARASAKYCKSSCRAMASKARARTESASDATVSTLPGAEAKGQLEMITLATIGNAAQTPLGRQAVILAKRLDAGVSDGALAAVSKRYSDLMDQLDKLQQSAQDENVQDDPIAHLRQRAAERWGESVGTGSVGAG